MLRFIFCDSMMCDAYVSTVVVQGERYAPAVQKMIDR
jgi:hypothetical protein